MKKINYLLIAAIASLTVASCQKEQAVVRMTHDSGMRSCKCRDSRERMQNEKIKQPYNI